MLKEKIAYVLKHYPTIMLFFRLVMNTVFKTVGLFIKTDEKLVLLNSYGGEQYSDSPRILFESMLKDKRFDGFRYIWAVVNPSEFVIPNAKVIKIDTWVYFKTALKAKIWISNVNIERGLHFKKNATIYINTWHGVGPKKGGNAFEGRRDYDFSNVDIFCANGNYSKEIFSKYWNTKVENMLFCGRPREDSLFRLTEKDKAGIRQALHIKEGKKVILYMPTWREYDAKEINYDLWEEKLKDDYVVLVRTHHWGKNALNHEKDDFWIDVTKYEDLNQLYYISDILISDYSSALFDFGLLGRPLICFAYDYERYEKLLFIKLKDEFPSGIKRTDEEVIDYILTMNYQEESEKCKAYVDSYVTHSGHATEEILNRLYQLLNEPKWT